MSTGRIQLWGHAIAVDWAEPEVEVDEDTMSTVKILYIRNLMLATTEETIEQEFNTIKPGKIHHLNTNIYIRTVMLTNLKPVFLDSTELDQIKKKKE